MSKECACGICGEEFPSLDGLSKHECKISLTEAYDRAFGTVNQAIWDTVKNRSDKK